MRLQHAPASALHETQFRHESHDGQKQLQDRLEFLLVLETRKSRRLRLASPTPVSMSGVHDKVIKPMPVARA